MPQLYHKRWEKNLSSFSGDLLDNHKINIDEYDKIRTKGSRPGILYGNAKTHKPFVSNLLKFPLILSTINTPGWPGILYGNAKIHKPFVNNLLKFRLILSAINTPGYNIAKFLMNLLLRIHSILLRK